MSCFKMLIVATFIILLGCDSPLPEAQKFGREFAEHVHAGQYEAAYEKTALSYQKKISFEQFTTLVESRKSEFSSKGPTAITVEVPDRTPGLFSRTRIWRANYWMSAPENERPLQLVAFLVEQETEEPAFWVADLRFVERPGQGEVKTGTELKRSSRIPGRPTK